VLYLAPALAVSAFCATDPAASVSTGTTISGCFAPEEDCASRDLAVITDYRATLAAIACVTAP
jgi:hypothetical protein